MKAHFGCIYYGSKRFWKLCRNHFKCVRCRKEITKSTGGFKLSKYQNNLATGSALRLGNILQFRKK